MAGAIVPIVASLLPVIVPEVKAFIQLVEGAFAKKQPPTPAPDTPIGPMKMDTVIQLVQSLLTSLNGSGVVQPDKNTIQGFIEGLFQDMKAAGQINNNSFRGTIVGDSPLPGSNASLENGTYVSSKVTLVHLGGNPLLILP